jgi:class 3 adenylate cyclase/predicted ATPase
LKGNWQTTLAEDLLKLSETVSSRIRSETLLRKGERRNVAVLFLDLKGFTDMSEKLDHEVVYELVSGVMKALTAVVEGFGGYVDKIEGDRIMALFGARQAAENDSIRAVACGLKMAETIEGVNRILAEKNLELGFRGGISRGPVTVAPDALGHLTATGDTVNIASRMEETAPKNTFHVEQTAREDCGESFMWEDLGEMKVKGKKIPLRTFVATGPGTVQTQRWERASRMASSPLVARKNEIAFLKRAWKDLKSGATGTSRRGSPRHMVLGITGDAGIGKSRLVHEFLRSQKMTGPIRVLRGQTISYGQPAFWLWSTLTESALSKGGTSDGVHETVEEFVSGLVRNVEDMNTVSPLIESTDYLVQLVSGAEETSDSSGPDEKTRQMEIMLAVRNLLRVVGCTGRTVLVLEDLHWMDEASAKTLEFVLSNCDMPDPMLVICLYRSDAETEPSGMLNSAGDYAEFRELRLDPVDPGGSMELVSHMLRSSCSREIEDFILKRSMGNPLFLEEMVMDLVESGLIVETDGIWKFCTSPGNIYVPDSLEGLVHSRLDRLSSSVKENLQICSVLGSEFSGNLFAEVKKRLGSPAGESDPLGSLLEMGFLVRKSGVQREGFSFRHVLIHDIVYATLLHCNRRTLHRLAAEAMEEASRGEAEAASAIISSHWELAGDFEKAVEWGLAALRLQRWSYQTTEGLVLAEKLIGWLEQWQGDPIRIEQLLTVLESYHLFLGFRGRREDQFRITDRILGMSNGEDRAVWRCKALRYKGIVFDQISRPSEAHECFEEALELARKLRLRDVEGSLMKDLAGALIDKGQLSEAEGLLRRAVRISIETDNRRTEGVALCTMGILKRRMGFEEQALEWYEQALEIQNELGDRWQIGIIQSCMGIAYSELGQLEKALEYCTAARDVGRETGNRVFEASQAANVGGFYMAQRKFEMAIESLLDAVLLHRETGNRHAEGLMLTNLGLAYRDAENPSKAIEHFRQAMVLHRETGDHRSEAAALECLALLMEDAGQFREASEHFMQALGIAEGSDDRDLEAGIICSVGELNAAEGQTEKAQDRYGQAIELIERCSLTGSDVPTLRILRMKLTEKGIDPDLLPLPAGWPEKAENSNEGRADIHRLHV